MRHKRPSLDTYLGSMFGLAVGDAFGAPIEFNVPGTFEQVTDLTGGGYFKLKPGEWTDDTSLALCSAESLLRSNGFDPNDHLETFLRWYRRGHLSSRKDAFGIGLVTAAALMRFESTHEPYCGPTGPKTAANGSVMHIAPIPLAYARNPTKALGLAAHCSRLTHGARESVDACRYLSMLILGSLYGYEKKKILETSFDSISPGIWNQKPLSPRIKRLAEGAFKSERSARISDKNYGSAAVTLQAALWAFYHTDTFEDGLIKVVNLGWDADTMGAVYGQLAGAYYGYTAIPKRWKEKVVKRVTIKKLAGGLHSLAQGIN